MVNGRVCSLGSVFLRVGEVKSFQTNPYECPIEDTSHGQILWKLVNVKGRPESPTPP